MAQQRRPRRGALLLVILSILVLFMLIGMTFILLASQYRSGAEAHALKDQNGDDPAMLLDASVTQLLCGVPAQSSLTSRSVMLGHGLLPDLYGSDYVTGTVATGSNYAVGGNNFFVKVTISNPVAANKRAIPASSDFFNGRVITILDGPLTGCSSRIVRSENNNLDLICEPFQSTRTLDTYPTDTGARILINGAPFNGTGAGFDGTSVSANAMMVNINAAGLNTTFDEGGLDEPWDAPDYQNMALAYIPTDDPNRIIPSFHRPSLVQSKGQTQQYMLRPLNEDDFTGSNPSFNAINGPWDVDNDRDGIPESVWIDLGFPTMTTSDGQVCRPLVAFMVVDMGGRAQANVHGSSLHAGGTHIPGKSGVGFGPADIDIDRLGLGACVTGRYGENDTSPGTSGRDTPAEQYQCDNLGMPNQFGTGTAPYPAPISLYGSPSDTWGRRILSLDSFGNPDWQNLGSNETHDIPYESNLLSRISGAGGLVDTPFTPAELERMLRQNDSDSLALPDRLQQIVTGPNNMKRVGTQDFSIPTPAIFLPRKIRQDTASGPEANKPELAFFESLKALLVYQESTIPTETFMRDYLPQELLRGEKMNVNRYFDYLYNKQTGALWTDFPGTTNGRLPEELKLDYAKRLFCLMMLLKDKNYLFPTKNNVDEAIKEELTTRRIAQWAVNVVDFRDVDGIMTRFEYDNNPFDGWTLDGTSKYVVYGCEHPELLLTETLAFHDKRLKDTNADASGQRRVKDAPMGALVPPADPDDIKEGDNDLDQFRAPEGSLFVELLATRSGGPNNSGSARTRPTELYNEQGLLDFNKTSPNGFPIWRMAITEDGNNGGIAKNELQELVTQSPDTVTFDPSQMTLGTAGAPGQRIIIDRFVYLGRKPNNADQQYPNATVYAYERGTQSLEPGKYMVVGPRSTTYVGSLKDDKPTSQSLRIQGNFFSMTGTTAQNQVAGNQPAGMVCSHEPAVGWNRRIGMSVSEPLPNNYYPVAPTESLAGWPEKDGYYDPADPEGGSVPPDEPFDSRTGKPLEKDSVVTTGTYQGYKSVMLQRLADPTKPYDPTLNPYITVDWMPIDLTVFNGTDEEPDNWADFETALGAFDPDDPKDAEVSFEARQRGEPGNTAQANIWLQNFSALDNAVGVKRAGSYFGNILSSSLGFLNRKTYGAAMGGGNHPNAPASGPFPWMTWLNRPFTNALELMLVTSSSPSRLCHEFYNERTGGVDNNPYTKRESYENDYLGYSGHLNFLQSGTGNSAHFYRIFDYVGVPSPFAGTRRWYNHTSAAINPSPTTLEESLVAPFNSLSRFRDPGRINLNTINDAEVFASLTTNVTWDTFKASRSGGSGLNTPFGNPFRPASAYDLTAQPPDSPIKATIMRPASDTATHPLFRSLDVTGNRDWKQNPYFEYEEMMRVSNLVTTQSNVFAVWITVGYFAVDPDTGKLGAEVNADMGNAQRHRGFYIIDRSIPVACEPGATHNAEDAILLRRFIE